MKFDKNVCVKVLTQSCNDSLPKFPVSSTHEYQSKKRHQEEIAAAQENSQHSNAKRQNHRGDYHHRHSRGQQDYDRGRERDRENDRDRERQYYSHDRHRGYNSRAGRSRSRSKSRERRK